MPSNLAGIGLLDAQGVTACGVEALWLYHADGETDKPDKNSASCRLVDSIEEDK